MTKVHHRIRVILGFSTVKVAVLIAGARNIYAKMFADATQFPSPNPTMAAFARAAVQRPRDGRTPGPLSDPRRVDPPRCGGARARHWIAAGSCLCSDACRRLARNRHRAYRSGGYESRCDSSSCLASACSYELEAVWDRILWLSIRFGGSSDSYERVATLCPSNRERAWR